MSDKKVEEWLLNNNWCSMPFHHINIDTNGDALSCCKGAPITTDSGQILNIKTMSLEEIWTHPARKEVLESFMRNEQHPSCWKCWRESNPKYSGRVKFSMQPGNIGLAKMRMKNPKYMPSVKTPKSLEIRPGNICNLRCRICTYWASTSWASDTHKLWFANTPYKETPIPRYNREAQWFDEDVIWEDVSILKDVRYIHLLGGEPMMAEKHFKMLDRLSRITDVSDITIKYNTNATIIPAPENIDILSRYGEVIVGCSIDDMGPRFEYQRKNAVWDEVVKNIDHFLTLTKHIYIDCTVSLLNGYYIDEFFNFCDSKGWVNRMPVDHFVQGNGLDLRMMLPKEKEFFAKKLEKGTNKRTPGILEYMLSQDLWSVDSQNMRYKVVKELDTIRGESFYDVCPDLKGIMNFDYIPVEQ